MGYLRAMIVREEKSLEFSYAHAPTLEKFARSNAKLRGVMGPIGSGKTVACGPIEILVRAVAQAPAADGIRYTRWIVVRNTRSQLKDTVLRTFLEWIPPSFGKFNKTDLNFHLKFHDVDCEILFRALDDFDDIKKIKSMDLTGGFVNEAPYIPLAVMNTIMERCGRYPRGRRGEPTWYGMWMDCNAPDEDSWYYKMAEESRPLNARFFRQPSGRALDAENISNLPPTYYHDLAEINGETWAKINVDAQYGFLKHGKPVFPEYDDSIHCLEIAEPVENVPVGLGIDQGLSPSVGFFQTLPSGRVLGFDEFIGDNIGAENFVPSVLQYFVKKYPNLKLDENGVIGDPASYSRSDVDERTVASIWNAHLQSQGVTLRPGAQAIRLRLESVKYGLTRLIGKYPSFIIHPRMKKLRKAMAGKYCYRKLNISYGEKYTEKPEKDEFSHIADAAQYYLSHVFGGHLVTVSRDWDGGDLQHDNPRGSSGQSEITGY
jgi:hypothetical protein